MKKLSKILLLLAILLVALVAATACGGVSEITVKEDRMPQLVHVLGEELDLSDGVLLLPDGQEVEMSAEGVEISGYDKNTLGEQTVTIKYMGAETTLKVTVVPRMVLNDLTADYLVGDAFDEENGTVKITRNDGSNFTLVLKNDKISVEGFDTTSAGDINLTIKYTNGDTVYECGFAAKVHEVENIKFNAPTKVAYNSHDGVLDVSGGYFTLSGKGGELKRDVPITEEMVEGFDISLVNADNSPLNRELTVKYGNKDYKYSVKLTYSDISIFKDNAKPLLSLDWSGNFEDIMYGDAEPQFTDEQGIAALGLIEKYLEFSPAERTFITSNEVLSVARTAMTYGFLTWADEIQKYNEAFAIEYGEFVFKCQSREALEAAIEGLADKTTVLYTYSPILLDMTEVFKEETVYSDITFADFPVLGNDYYESITELFEYMIALDDKADKIGADWKTDITVYSEEIEAVYDAIVNGEYYSYEFSQFFYHISMWRDGDDLFDCLYSYYYGEKNDVAAVLSIANLRLPSKLEEVFAYVYNTMTLMGYISDDYYFLQVPDTTEFFYNYRKAMELSLAIVNSEDEADEMIQTLFYGLPLNSMLGISAENGIYTFNDILGYINTSAGGYYSLCGALLGVPGFEALMDKYLDVAGKNLENENYYGSEEYIADVKAMFALYTALTPSEQFNFLGALSTYYVRGYMPMAFDNVTEGYSEISTIFVDMINGVYTDMFEGEDAKNAYLQLIFATEVYAQRYVYSALHSTVDKTWLEDFTERMNSVTAALGTMSDADKALFNTELGSLYTTYKAILDDYSSEDDGEVDLGEWADDFKELEEAVLNLELAYAIVNESGAYYDLFFTAYERVIAIANRILGDSTVPASVKEVFIYDEIYSTSALDKMIDPDFVIDPEDEVFWSYDYVISVYRSIYVNALLAMDSGAGLYDYYQQYGLADFMNRVYDVIWAYMGAEKDATDMFEKDKVLEAMKEFAKMDVNAQMLFILYVEGDNGLYYTAISAFLKEEFSANVAAVGELLVELEMDAIIYNYYALLLDNGEATEEELTEAAAELVNSYSALADAITQLSVGEQEAFNTAFEEIINVYKALAEQAGYTPPAEG